MQADQDQLQPVNDFLHPETAWPSF